MQNRELKFRIYSYIDKRFHYFDIYNYPDGIAGGVSEPQQYTGLKDRNNKEIFEGDIVKTYDGHVSQICSDYVEYSRGQVIWLREGFNVCQKHIGSVPIHIYVTCDCCPCGLEVIGNIFENPELIQHENN
jgi:uncharacterized phage protein (TIGR01671 family)